MSSQHSWAHVILEEKSGFVIFNYNVKMCLILLCLFILLSKSYTRFTVNSVISACAHYHHNYIPSVYVTYMMPLIRKMYLNEIIYSVNI